MDIGLDSADSAVELTIAVLSIHRLSFYILWNLVYIKIDLFLKQIVDIFRILASANMQKRACQIRDPSNCPYTNRLIDTTIRLTIASKYIQLFQKMSKVTRQSASLVKLDSQQSSFLLNHWEHDAKNQPHQQNLFLV